MIVQIVDILQTRQRLLPEIRKCTLSDQRVINRCLGKWGIRQKIQEMEEKS